ncbi:MAG: hypothetical protein DMG67_16265, partial [Acidobacteria bacterium]
LRLFFPVTARDLMVLGYAIFRNWRLLSALVYPLRHMGRFRRKRQWIESRRKISDRQLLHWFSNLPTSEPLESDQR